MRFPLFLSWDFRPRALMCSFEINFFWVHSSIKSLFQKTEFSINLAQSFQFSFRRSARIIKRSYVRFLREMKNISRVRYQKLDEAKRYLLQKLRETFQSLSASANTRTSHKSIEPSIFLRSLALMRGWMRSKQIKTSFYEIKTFQSKVKVVGSNGKSDNQVYFSSPFSRARQFEK